MSERTVFVVDDDFSVRKSLRALLTVSGYKIRDYPSAAEFLADDLGAGSCLVVDIRMPEMNGLALQEELLLRGSVLPVIFITGHADVPLAVRTMTAGAIDFLEKPFDDERILGSIARALDIGSRARNFKEETDSANDLLSLLTPRELEVLDQLVAGRSNKLAAYNMKISPRTVEIHRARVMDKLQARSLSDLVRTAIAGSRRQRASLVAATH